MYPLNFNFFGISIRGYEGHWAFGILIMGYIWQRRNCLKAGYSSDWFLNAFSTAILSGIIFSRLFHFLFWDTNNFLANPMIIFTSSGGFAILGGTVGTAFGGYLYCKFTNESFLRWCDYLMVPLTFGLAISRFSCFLNGDAYGSPTDSIFGVVFSENSDAWMEKWRSLHSLYANSDKPLNIISQIFVNQVNLMDIPLPDALSKLKEEGYTNLASLSKLYPPVASGNYKEILISKGLFPFPVVYPKVHPTQLYETALVSILFVFLWKIQNFEWTKEKLFFFFWIGYAMNRFIIEFFRGDQNILALNLTYAQFISLTIVTVSLFILKIKNLEYSRN